MATKIPATATTYWEAIDTMDQLLASTTAQARTLSPSTIESLTLLGPSLGKILGIDPWIIHQKFR